jgi:hypothetical protein
MIRTLRPAPRSVLLVISLAAACGDNLAGPPDAAARDAAPRAPRAVIAAGTFKAGEAGVLSALSFEPLRVAQRVAPSGAVGDDPMIRRAGGELLVVNRADGNNVTILDDETFAVKAQLATGAGSNPQDVAVYGDKLFVPAFGTAGVVVLTRGGGAPATIDLSALDPDGQPNCVSAYTVGTEVYVVCELLDASYAPRGPGQVAVIDAATNAVVTTFPLAGANPLGTLEQLPAGVLGGDLVIPTAPDLIMGDPTTGCVERIQTGPAPHSNGCIVANAALGGFVARVDVQPADAPVLWMVVSSYDTAPHGNLQGYDLATSKLWPAPVSPSTQVLADLAVCPNDTIVVADQTMAANGLRVYRGTAEQTSAPMPIGLRPGSSHGLLCYQ